MKRIASVLILVSLISGCATSTVESRKKARAAEYNALSADEKSLVDKGQIRVGMPRDAVYIAWGAPAQILQSESGDSGVATTWLYEGSYIQETSYWNFQEVPYRGGVLLERYIDHDYNPQQYISAEIVFVNDRVVQWRTLPRPAY
ncbi:MAG TPA: hypothetical protein VLU94_02750 [Candidatus Nitrosotalea sp.]|nr:hypothetical protein [Candidatus Nitrosotalea sp.]